MVAGIDVCKDGIDVYLLEGGKGQAFRLSNDAAGIRALVRKLRGVDRALMEATGTYHLACAEALFGAGIEVVVANPKRAHHFAKCKLARNKTDRLDARLLAEFAECQGHLSWRPASTQVKELQGLLRVRQALVKERNAHQARVKAPGITEFELGYYRSECERLKLEIRSLEKLIASCVAADPELSRKLELLLSIPGLGLITAATTLALIPGDLASAKQASAFVGLNPKRLESGPMKGLTRISKTGHGRLRQLFALAARAACNAKGPLRDFYLHLVERGKPKASAMIAVANKLVRIAHAVLRTGQPFAATHLTNA